MVGGSGTKDEVPDPLVIKALLERLELSRPNAEQRLRSYQSRKQ